MRAAVIAVPQPSAVPTLVTDRAEPVTGPGETLVRVTAAALAHLDVSVGTGDFAGSPPPPYVTGCDGAGVVEIGVRLQKAFRTLSRLGDGRYADAARRH